MSLRARGFDSVLFLSPFLWDGIWQTTHYFAAHLSKQLPVVFVEPPPVWNPSDRNFRLGRLAVTRGRRRLTHDGQITLLAPRSLPLGRWRTIRRLQDGIYARQAASLLKDHELRRPLLWLSYYEGVVEHRRLLGEPPYVYHSLDYFDNDEARELTARASLVLAVSEPLKARHQAINPNTHLLPNGVALDWLDDDRRVAVDLGGERRKLGFVGTLSRHVDFALLVRVADAFPEQELVVVGPIVSELMAGQREALARLRTRRNVRLLGFRPPRDVFGYIRAFDVCLMPFVPDDWIAHSDPSKFYQYLALGKPVVTTPLPAADRYHHLCYPASSHDEFVRQIERALDRSDLTLAAERRRVARDHDWRNQVASATRIVEETFDSRLAPRLDSGAARSLP
jgi:glycosyltransferase involved in cell wall biosynthesis